MHMTRPTRTVRCRSVFMCSSDSYKYVVSQDQQSEADIGPKKRKDQDAADSPQKDRIKQACLCWQISFQNYDVMV